MLFCSLKNQAEFKFINDFGTKYVTKNLIIIALDFRKIQSYGMNISKDSSNSKKSHELYLIHSNYIPKSFFKLEQLGGVSNVPTIFRLGLKVSRKYGNAVKRNLFKRRIRAILSSMSKAHDITSKSLIVIPKQSARYALYQDLLIQIQSILLSFN